MGKRGPNMPAISRLLGNAKQGLGEIHPIVSAVQFAHLTATTGGATMNAHTRQFTGIGDEGYGVGGMRADRPIREYGERTASGKVARSNRQRIPGRNVDALPGSVTKDGSDMSLETVLNQRRRVARMTKGNPDANVGSWSHGTGKVGIDASEVEPSLELAKAKGIRRHEDAIFDYKNGVDIELPTSRKQKKV